MSRHGDEHEHDAHVVAFSAFVMGPMHLEFLADGAAECPLLRFYRWGDGEVSLLREATERLATGASRSIEVHQLPFVEAMGGITFRWVAHPWDRGVLLPEDGRSFIMQLPPELW